MKKRKTKIGWVITTIAFITFLMSFTVKKKQSVLSGKSGSEEYYEVRNFVQKKICMVLSKNDADAGIKLKYFGRCPSGYQSAIADARDSVKLDKYVYGKIKLYEGCRGNYVCDFKVCVNKNSAELKSAEMTEYVSVDEWLKSKGKKKEPELKVKEKATEVKG